MNPRAIPTKIFTLEAGSSTVPNQPFQSFSIPRLNANLVGSANCITLFPGESVCIPSTLENPQSNVPEDLTGIIARVLFSDNTPIECRDKYSEDDKEYLRKLDMNELEKKCEKLWEKIKSKKTEDRESEVVNFNKTLNAGFKLKLMVNDERGLKLKMIDTKGILVSTNGFGLWGAALPTQKKV